MYSPDTQVILLTTPLTMDGEHQLLFETREEQASYFNSCPSLPISNFTFQRKDNVIRIGANIETLYVFNYVMYKNTRFSNKWFYAYITKLEYANENVTYAYIKTDVFQTWFYDVTFNKSFVERQHESLDEYNTISDNVPEGTLIAGESIEYNFQGGYFIFCSSDITQDDTTTSQQYSFILEGYTIPCMVLYFAENEAQKMARVMQAISNHGWGDRVLSAVYVPVLGNTLNLNVLNLTVSTLPETIHVCQSFNDMGGLTDELTFNFDTNVMHKKSLTYPYARIEIQDMTTGQIVVLMPEKFASFPPKFKLQCSLSETPSYKVIPMDYDGLPLAFNQALVTRCNTSLPVTNNSYAKYLMMNGDMNKLQMVAGGVGILGSLFTGSAMGAITGAEHIMHVVAQEKQAAKIPNQVSAITDGAMERIIFQNGVKITLFTMDTFHQNVADDYWNMFGYPIRRLEEPEWNGGDIYNFIKMINPNIEANGIPQEDILEIQSILSKGVTVWHNPNLYKKY